MCDKRLTMVSLTWLKPKNELVLSKQSPQTAGSVTFDSIRPPHPIPRSSPSYSLIAGNKHDYQTRQFKTHAHMKPQQKKCLF